MFSIVGIVPDSLYMLVCCNGMVSEHSLSSYSHITWIASTSWTTRSAEIVRSSFSGPPHALLGSFTSKHVEAISNMEHGVTVDTVVPCITALESIQCTAEVVLLVEQVVELQHDGQGLSF